MAETKGSILRFALFYALSKVRLARHKLSEDDRRRTAEDTIKELRRHGGWKDLDDPVVPFHHWDRDSQHKR